MQSLRRFAPPLLVLLACLTLCAPLGAQQQSPATSDAPLRQETLPLTVLVQKCSPAVVLIEAQLSCGTSQGSGVILDPTGKVLTCNHVVSNARSVLVKTWNGGYFPAEGLLGVNPAADIALLRLRSQALPTVPMGDAYALVQGEKVFVISSPVGLENTVSEGVVGGLRRFTDLPEDLRTRLLGWGFRDDQMLIQFTAPTSPGSSGGPVFNGRGEVVGIVSIGIPNTANIYFAIPAGLVEPHLRSETVLKFEAGGTGMTASTIGAVNPKLGELPPWVGTCEPVETSCLLTVPREPEPSVWLKGGLFVLADSVSVSCSDGDDKLVCVQQKPHKGQFAVASGGLVFFNTGDGGRQVTIAYTYRPERAAVLPVANRSGYPELADVLRQALQKKLVERGYEVAPSIEVDAVSRSVGLNTAGVVQVPAEELSLENIRRFAAEANCALIVFSTINADASSGLRGEEVAVGIRFAVFDGHTGKDLYTRELRDTRGSTFGSNKRVRAVLIDDLTARMFDEFLT